MTKDEFMVTLKNIAQECQMRYAVYLWSVDDRVHIKTFSAIAAIEINEDNISFWLGETIGENCLWLQLSDSFWFEQVIDPEALEENIDLAFNIGSIDVPEWHFRIDVMDLDIHEFI